MKESVFSTFFKYIVFVLRGIGSSVASVGAALPYLFGFRSGELYREVTEQYPDRVSSRTPDELPQRFRGLLINNIDKCTGCGDCQKVCPVQCITVENEKKHDSPKTWVAVYDIDFARCVFCGLCVESCVPQSLVHTRQFEAAVYYLPDLVAHFGKGRLSPEYRRKHTYGEGGL